MRFWMERRRRGWAVVECDANGKRTISIHADETAAARTLNLITFGRAS
jgi:hypothetical protein